MLNNIVQSVSTDKTKKWEIVVTEAVNNYGNPKAFWHKINQLLGKKSNNKTLTLHHHSPDGTTTKITGGQNMANLMSQRWETVFQEHKDPQFDNDNVKKVTDWYKDSKPKFDHLNTIQLDSLIPDHPIMRPFETTEIQTAIKHTGNKAPGMSEWYQSNSH